MIDTELRLETGERIGSLWIARSRRERLRGLLGRDGLEAGRLLLLERCGAVHTVGMRFPIDVLFLDRDWRVVGLRRALSPGRLAWGGWRAVRTLEAAAGWLDLERLRATRCLPPPSPGA